jgi:autotransporter adhesin
MPEAPQKRKMVVIEEGTLTSMALNPKIAAAFPILAPIAKLARGTAKGKPGCGSCGRASQERAKIFQQVKQGLANMDATRKRQLKDLMNAQSMRLLYRDSKNRAQQLTF